jgi:hypothetical protein
MPRDWPSTVSRRIVSSVGIAALRCSPLCRFPFFGGGLKARFHGLPVFCLDRHAPVLIWLWTVVFESTVLRVHGPDEPTEAVKVVERENTVPLGEPVDGEEGNAAERPTIVAVGAELPERIPEERQVMGYLRFRWEWLGTLSPARFEVGLLAAVGELPVEGAG